MLREVIIAWGSLLIGYIIGYWVCRITGKKDGKSPKEILEEQEKLALEAEQKELNKGFINN